MLLEPATGLGLTLLIVGPVPPIGNVCAGEVPPPGDGLNTVTEALPAVAMSAAVMLACSPVTRLPVYTGVVVRLVPFQRTVAVEANVLPLTVSVNAEPPAV